MAKVVTEKEMDEVVNKCTDLENEGQTNVPGMTYEQGVKAAVEWIQGHGDNPLEN